MGLLAESISCVVFAGLWCGCASGRCCSRSFDEPLRRLVLYVVMHSYSSGAEMVDLTVISFWTYNIFLPVVETIGGTR